MNRQNYQLEKLTRRRTGFPIATVAYYGPDDQFASKVAVGIILFENNPDPIDMKKWFTADLDVRKAPSILSEILAYLETFGSAISAASGQLECRRRAGFCHSRPVDTGLRRRAR